MKKEMERLRRILDDSHLSIREKDDIVSAVERENQAVPGPIQNIAWAVLMEYGHMGLAHKVTTDDLLWDEALNRRVK